MEGKQEQDKEDRKGQDEQDKKEKMDLRKCTQDHFELTILYARIYEEVH